MIPYAMTKTALLSISRGLAKAMGGTGVTVNALLPGPTLSEGLVALLREQQGDSGKSLDDVAVDFIKAHRPSSIIQRPASVEEVANFAVYLSSPLASATTGAALRVDGGTAESIV
jgi:NAD(P)-dependent dehydrogenase (short-subunit alcohol dehydrogenase family)